MTREEIEADIAKLRAWLGELDWAEARIEQAKTLAACQLHGRIMFERMREMIVAMLEDNTAALDKLGGDA